MEISIFTRKPQEICKIACGFYSIEWIMPILLFQRAGVAFG
jgi:hypothetical protein